MSAFVFSLTYICDVCLCTHTGGLLPNGWVGPNKATDPEQKTVEHLCGDCIACFSAWRDSRRQAQKARIDAKFKKPSASKTRKR